MFLFPRLPATRRLRCEALRELYRSYRSENTCEARGLRLLREWLSPCQREQFDAQGYFDVITGDVMLAQKIALETFERRALAVANRCLIVDLRSNAGRAGRANTPRPST